MVSQESGFQRRKTRIEQKGGGWGREDTEKAQVTEKVEKRD